MRKSMWNVNVKVMLILFLYLLLIIMNEQEMFFPRMKKQPNGARVEDSVLIRCGDLDAWFSSGCECDKHLNVRYTSAGLTAFACCYETGDGLLLERLDRRGIPIDSPFRGVVTFSEMEKFAKSVELGVVLREVEVDVSEGDFSPGGWPVIRQ